MIYFIYGEDNYQIRKKTEKLIRPDSDIVRLNGKSLNKEQFVQSILGTSLFTSVKFVIIGSFLADSNDNDLKKQIAAYLDKVPKDVDLAFIENGKPDARSALYKALMSKAKVLECPNLNPAQLSMWIEKKVESFGVKISSPAKSKLAYVIGADLWRMENEISKLFFYSNSLGLSEIAVDHVELLVRSENESNMFGFIEALASKNAKRALLLLNNLRNNGEADQYIFSMIVYQYRQLLIVADLLKRGIPASVIPQKAGMHPFVARKTLEIVKHYQFAELKKLYRELEECDQSMKTSTSFDGFVLDLFVAKVTKG
jgi:DNA polymerase-3 subunit delta